MFLILRIIGKFLLCNLALLKSMLSENKKMNPYTSAFKLVMKSLKVPESAANGIFFS